MAGLELVTLNTKAGYGNNSSRIDRDGTTETLETSGAAVSGDLELGFTGKSENGTSRGKAGVNLVTAKADALVGQAHDKYLRLSLDLGPVYHYDISTYSRVRIAWQAGLTGKFEYADLQAGDNSAAGHNFNAALPVSFGLGTSHIFLEDRAQLMTNFSAVKFSNLASGSWRIYANFNNRYLQTVDVTLSHAYESGKLAGGINEKSSLVMAGLSLGLFNYSLKAD